MAGFFAKSFNPQEEENIQHLLTEVLCQRSLSRGLDSLKQKFIHLANKIFKFNGWSYSVSKENIDFVDNQDGTFKVGACVFVKVQLKDGCFREDIGYGFYESVLKGTAIQNALKLACADALVETLKGMGKAFSYLYADDFEISDKVNLVRAPSVQTDSSSVNLSDDQEFSRRTGRNPLGTRGGRKRRNQLRSSSRIRNMQSLFAQQEPVLSNESRATNSFMTYGTSKKSYGVEQGSSSQTMFHPTCTLQGSASEAPTEVHEPFKVVRRTSIRGRRGRRRRGRRMLSTIHWKRALAITAQQTEEARKNALPPSSQTPSKSPVVATDAAPTSHRELEEDPSSDVEVQIVDHSNTHAAGSTSTADESMLNSSYFAVMHTDWMHDTNTCNSQAANFKSQYRSIRTDASAQSCAVQLDRVNFAFREEIPEDMPPQLVANPRVPKAGALDLSTTSASSSHFGHLQNYGDIQRVISNTNSMMGLF